MPYIKEWVKVGGKKKLRVWKKVGGKKGKKVGDFSSKEAFEKYRRYAERAAKD